MRAVFACVLYEIRLMPFFDTRALAFTSDVETATDDLDSQGWQDLIDLLDEQAEATMDEWSSVVF